MRVIVPDVGGSFGTKRGLSPPEVLVAWVARRISGGRLAGTSSDRRGCSTWATAAARSSTPPSAETADGTLRALRVDVVQDAGAYPDVGSLLPRMLTVMGAGPYRHPRGRDHDPIGGDQHRAAAGLPGGRPTRSNGDDRADGGSLRPRDRPRSRGRAPPQSGAGRCVPLHLGHRGPLRRRAATSDCPRRRPGRRRRSSSSGAEQAAPPSRAAPAPCSGIGISTYVEITNPGRRRRLRSHRGARLGAGPW